MAAILRNVDDRNTGDRNAGDNPEIIGRDPLQAARARHRGGNLPQPEDFHAMHCHARPPEIFPVAGGVRAIGHGGSRRAGLMIAGYKPQQFCGTHGLPALAVVSRQWMIDMEFKYHPGELFMILAA